MTAPEHAIFSYRLPYSAQDEPASGSLIRIVRSSNFKVYFRRVGAPRDHVTDLVEIRHGDILLVVAGTNIKGGCCVTELLREGELLEAPTNFFTSTPNWYETLVPA